MHVFIQIKHTIFYTFSDLIFFHSKSHLQFTYNGPLKIKEIKPVNPKGNQP